MADNEGVNFPQMAINAVKRTNRDLLGAKAYVVWFAYVLGGWKALVSTDVPDGRYYEVTYNKDKEEAYVDTYNKIDNVAIGVRDLL